MVAALLSTASAWAQAPNAPFDVPAAIRAAVKLTPEAMLTGAQVSGLRATSGPQLGDAMTCLKLAGTPGGYIAVFFDNGKVLSYRRAVALDRCEQGTFAQLAAAPAAKVKAAQKKPAHAAPPVPHHAEAK